MTRNSDHLLSGDLENRGSGEGHSSSIASLKKRGIEKPRESSEIGPRKKKKGQVSIDVG